MSMKFVLPFVLLTTACTVEPGRFGDGKPSLKTAQTALSSGAADLAYRICASLVDAGDRTPRALVCKANALTALGRSAEALASFDAALAVEPNYGDALIGTGRLRLTTDPAGAEQVFMQVLANNPRDAIALNNLGIARDLQGRHSDAQTAYAEAIAANPDARAPQVNLALSMAMTGRAREATRILRPLADNADATARERHDYAAVLTMAGRPEEATPYLTPELSAPQAQEAVSGFRAIPTSQPAPLPTARVVATRPTREQAVPAGGPARTMVQPAEDAAGPPIVLAPIAVAAAPALSQAPTQVIERTAPAAVEAAAEPIKLTPATDAPAPARAPAP